MVINFLNFIPSLPYIEINTFQEVSMARSLKFYTVRILQCVACLVLLIIIATAITFAIVTAPPDTVADDTHIVNDVTRLNPVSVDQIKRPRTVEEIVALVRGNEGAVSIGGARHSMGGQIGTENALHLDMRDFDEIVLYDRQQKEITVQTGITWRKIQEVIDKDDLSIMIMQTYANFTVGGSLSVNVHGRYIGQGPIIHSVRSLKVVLADGNVVSASPHENAEVFYGCIGGYGGLGVIVEATLMLTDNCKVERFSETMSIDRYYNYFVDSIRNDSLVVFHNADIYPDSYSEVRAVSFVKTGKAVTEPLRLKPVDKNYRMERFAMWLVSEMPGGKWIRRNWGDPLYYNSERVEWRNYEASFDAMELEPSSRKKSTYVLQEYFVPVNEFNAFVPVMTEIFERHDVNVINISIRHTRKDPGSILAWATEDVFCFVIYYKQGTSDDEKKEVGAWTRKLIDAAIEHRGSYYLPYQIHASREQFKEAYPNSPRFFELKMKLDPTNKFRNKLWDTYYVRP